MEEELRYISAWDIDKTLRNDGVKINYMADYYSPEWVKAIDHFVVVIQNIRDKNHEEQDLHSMVLGAIDAYYFVFWASGAKDDKHHQQHSS